MTSFKQIEANRRNARNSTGPITEEGKSARETVIGALEDAEDYKAFEAIISADYDAQSAVERELVLRLASLLWRLRRATTMETGLFEIQAEQLKESKRAPTCCAGLSRGCLCSVRARSLGQLRSRSGLRRASRTQQLCPAPARDPLNRRLLPLVDLARCFFRLANLPNFALDRLSRYEATGASGVRTANRACYRLQSLAPKFPAQK